MVKVISSRYAKPSIGQTILYIIVLTFVISFVVWLLTPPFELHFLEGLGKFLAFPLAIFAILKWRSGFDKEKPSFADQHEQSQPQNQSERLDLNLNKAVLYFLFHFGELKSGFDIN